MDKELFLNHQVSKILNISPRQVQSWTDKGVIRPEREAIGGGSKRGYNYVNLIEIGMCRKLLDCGQGIQSVKTILHRVRERNMLIEWINDPHNFFSKQWKNGILLWSPKVNPIISKSDWKEVGESLHEIFVGETELPDKMGGSGILLYFFNTGVPYIFPAVRMSFAPKLLKGAYMLYSYVTLASELISIDVAWIRNEINAALS